MKTIRTFLAVPLPPMLVRTASDWMAEMRGGQADSRYLSAKNAANPGKDRTNAAQPSAGIKWVPEDNLHLTLKFLGEVENVETPRVCDVVTDVCSQFEPFPLNFGGTDFLPDEARARVLSVAIDDPTASLIAMVGQFEDRFADMGYKRESRDYRPHLTLGRVRSGTRKASETVIENWKRRSDDYLGQMTADCVQVIGSFLDKSGPTYNVMYTADL